MGADESKNVKPPISDPPPEEDGNDIKAQLVLTLRANGNVEVSGPVENRLLCYSILEFAKDAIQEHHLGKPRIARPENNPGWFRQFLQKKH